MTYELTLLLREENELKEVKDIITSADAKLVSEESWGKKNLAYPIKKEGSALFYNFVVELDEKKVSGFKQKLNFNEKLLRYLLLKKE